MKITKIEQQKKNLQRYSIYVDDIFLLGIHEEVLLKAGLKIGVEISPEKLDSLKVDDEYQIAWQKSLGSIGRSKKSERDMRIKLKDFSPEIVDQIIERLKEYSLINDVEFARSLTNDYIHIRRYSARAIQQKLIQKGINKEIITDILRDIDSESVENNIRELIEKKERVGRSREQIVRFLAGKGFSWDQIKQALEKNTHS